jgi:hypothetical protein
MAGEEAVVSLPDEERPEATNSRRTGARRVWLDAGIAAAALLVACAVFVGALDPELALSNLFPRPAPAGWHAYHDPAGYFTIAVPAGWTAQTFSGETTEGNVYTGQSATFPNYDTILGNPPIGESTLRVGISVSPHTTPFERQWDCQDHGFPNTLLAGLPAVHYERDVWGSWLLNTDTAHYQIDLIPVGFHGNALESGVPTPVPQATVQAENQLAPRILATFTPIPATWFFC